MPGCWIGRIVVGPWRAAARAAARAAGLAAILAAGGCAAATAPPPAPQPAAPPTAELGPAATAYRLTGPWPRLFDDIPRAITRVEWALMRLRPRPGWDENDRRLYPDGPIRATALLPDDRTAYILAHREPDPDHVVVVVRVGRFGDKGAQDLFARQLAAVLAGDPIPRRDRHFRLPPLDRPAEQAVDTATEP